MATVTSSTTSVTVNDLSQYSLLLFAQSNYDATTGLNQIITIPYSAFKNIRKRIIVSADGINGYSFSYNTDTKITVSAFGSTAPHYTGYIYGIK